MGLTTWSDAPRGKITKGDVAIAKNCLSEFEMGQPERMVSAYLDFAETEFEKYRIIQDCLFLSDYDKYMLEVEASQKEADDH